MDCNMKTLLLILISFSCFGQVEDSLIAYSDRLPDTTLTKIIRCDNYEYKYLIQNGVNTTTFTLLNEKKLYTDYRKVGGLSYFFGAWALMIGHDAVQRDKFYHFVAGYSIGILTYAVTKKHRLIKSIAAATTIGVLKEIVNDWLMGYGSPSVKDAAWTSVGGYYGGVTIPMCKIKPVKPIFLD